MSPMSSATSETQHAPTAEAEARTAEAEAREATILPLPPMTLIECGVLTAAALIMLGDFREGGFYGEDLASLRRYRAALESAADKLAKAREADARRTQPQEDDDAR